MTKPLRIYKASAGSGKTFTLAVEYISLLAINPMEYQNILAVTFTNKATAEMKQRILGTLYGIANGLPSAEQYINPILSSMKEKLSSPHYAGMNHENMNIAGLNHGGISYDEKSQENSRAFLKARAKEALSNIIHDYSRFHIETIDSFFQSILHEIASELDLSVNIRVELDAEQVLSDAVDAVIENLNEQSNEFKTIIHFISEKINQNKSWKVDETVKTFGQNIFKENYLIHGNEVREAITNVNAIHLYKAMIEKIRDQKKKPIMDLATEMLDECEKTEFCPGGGKKAITTFLGKAKEYNIKEPSGKDLGTFSEKIEALTNDSEEWFNKTAKRKDELLTLVEGTLMPKMKQLFELHDTYLTHLHTVHAITQHIYSLMLLNKISETVREQNNEKSRFLLAETANFLRDVINDDDIPFIYEKAGSVIKHIMIDEFQDTSTLQWNNFKPLIMNSLSSDGSCLIVGDVKQSIYRFRNSDWQILNNIEEEPDLHDMIGNIPAKYNYRSSRRVVEFNNELFKNAVSLLTDRCSDLNTAYGDVEQIAKKDKDTGFVRVENIDYHDSKEAQDTENQDKQNNEYSQNHNEQHKEDTQNHNDQNIENDEVSEWNAPLSQDLNEAMLQRIKANVTELVQKGVDPNDITIITRTNGEIPVISDYFNEHPEDCPVKVVSDDAFRLDASPAIGIIINALRALAAENDRLHLISLAFDYSKLILPLLPASPNATPLPINLSTNPLSITLFSSSEIDQLLPEHFRRYERERMKMKSLIEQTEEIYRIFQLDKLDKQDSYMFCFHDIIEKFCADHQASTTLFLQEWDDNLHKNTIPNGASKGVKIMTMHKSKGLEFHSVIIPSCMWDIKPKNQEVMWCVPKESPYNQMPLLPISVSHATDDSIFAKDRQEEELRTLVDNINVLYVAFTRAKNNLIIITGNKPLNEKETKNGTGKKNDIKPQDPNTIETAQDFVVKALPKNMEKTDACNNVMMQWQRGTIVPTEQRGSIVPTEVKNNEKAKSDPAEKKNRMECYYTPLDVKFVSNESIAKFRQSYESDMFITADADDLKTQQHQKKIRLISLGNLYHNIFQMVHTSTDVPHAIRMLEAKGCFESLVEADEAQDKVTQLIENISNTHPEWFSSEWHVLNERTILFSQDELYMTKRPDRVIVNGDQAIIIDYKTARGALQKEKDGTLVAPAENVNQIKGYYQLLSQIGYKNIKAFLWYIFEDEVVKVNI